QDRRRRTRGTSSLAARELGARLGPRVIEALPKPPRWRHRTKADSPCPPSPSYDLFLLQAPSSCSRPSAVVPMTAARTPTPRAPAGPTPPRVARRPAGRRAAVPIPVGRAGRPVGPRRVAPATTAAVARGAAVTAAAATPAVMSSP